MKAIYKMLPQNVVKRIRNVIEFNGGVLDSSSYASGYDADFSAIGGYPRPYRLPPGSFPQARIPSGPAERAFDIKYYPRDARRNPWPGDKLADELSFTSEEAKALLATPELVKEPKLGSPGANNPDVIRYDPTGLRTAMTTNHASVQKSLSRHRAEHLPDPSWYREKKATANWMAAQAAKGAPVDRLPGQPRQFHNGYTKWSHVHSATDAATGLW